MKIQVRGVVPAIAACGLVALALTGCSSNSTPSTASSTPAVTETAGSDAAIPSSTGAITGTVVVQTTGADKGKIWDGDIQTSAIDALKTQFPTIDQQSNFGLECPTMKAEVGASQSCPLTSGASDKDIFDTTVTITAVDGGTATFEIAVADPAALAKAQG